jgi:hypothetical protein
MGAPWPAAFDVDFDLFDFDGFYFYISRITNRSVWNW